MTAGDVQNIPAVPRNRRAHGPWGDLALHTIGWRAFQDLCSQVCEVVLDRPVEIFREAQDGGQDAVFLIPSGTDMPPIGTVQCKHTSEAAKALKVSDLTAELDHSAWPHPRRDAPQLATLSFPVLPSQRGSVFQGNPAIPGTTSSFVLADEHFRQRSQDRRLRSSPSSRAVAR